MKKIFLTLLLIFSVTPVFAMGTTTVSVPMVCSTYSNFCSGTVINTVSNISTSTKKFILPKVGKRIKFSDSNFSIFPEQITPSNDGRKILVVSKKWQTACLYDESGRKYIVKQTDLVSTSTTQVFVGKPLCIQSATGKKDFPTELGLYNIQTKQSKDYKSTFYDNNGEKPESPDLGAPMPYAMHFGRIIGINSDRKLIYDFSDGSAIHEKQTFNRAGALPFVSHGCIAVEKGMGQTLQNVMTYGDLLLVINDSIPSSMQEMISINN